MFLKRNGWKGLMAMLVVVAMAAATALPASAESSPLVTGVRVAGGPGKLKVHVAATGEVQYRVLNVTDPRYSMVVEIFPAQLDTHVQKSIDVKSKLVEKVRIGQFSDNPDIVRLVVDLTAPTKYEVQMAPGNKGLTVAVDAGEVASAKVTKADVAPMAPASNVMPAPVMPSTPSTQTVVPSTPQPSGEADHTYHVRGNHMIAAETKSKVKITHHAAHLVSLDFVNADLIYVLKILSKEMDMNLVTDQSVKGSVTMTLKDVPAAGAFNLVLKISGYEYKQVDRTLVVGSKETLDRINADTLGIHMTAVGKQAILPIPLEHAKAASVADTIKGVYPGVDVQVQADQNFVIVRGQKDQLRDIKDFVQKLDVPPPPPVVLKTEVVPIKYSTVQTTLQLSKTLYPSLNYNVEDRLNSLIVTGNEHDIEALKAFLATVDIPLQQVMLDIKVVDLNEQGSKQLGFTIGNSTGTFGSFGGVGGTPVTFTETFPGGVATTQTSQLAIYSFQRTQWAIGMTLSLLINQSDAKVISSPRVMTQSGKESQVLIGDKFPIVYFDPRAGQFQVQYVDIGVKVVVKPIVTADGYVTIDMAPEVSTLKALINNQYPQTGITTVKTNVRCKDGDTVVVGGLLRELENVTVNKIPFLGDLPILGEFFRNSNVQKTKSEVFIMITPRIIQ